MVRVTGAAIVALALAVSACGGSDKAELDKLDSKLGGGKGDADPALTAALEGQVMVDPKLAGQSNQDGIRPANSPYGSPIPKGEKAGGGQTLGSIAAQQAKLSKDKFNGCSLDVEYSAQWSTRLPADLPLHPTAKVTEAAGSDYQGCSLRAVSYTVAQPTKAMGEYYTGIAKRAGYRTTITAEGQGSMVSGWRPSDGAAFYVILQPSEGGTSADLVSNRGR